MNINKRTILWDSNEISFESEIYSVEPKAMELLKLLFERKYEVVSNEEILSIVWKGVVVEYSTIQRTVSILRKLLGDNAKNPTVIKTVPKKGYQYIYESKKVNKKKPNFLKMLLFIFIIWLCFLLDVHRIFDEDAPRYSAFQEFKTYSDISNKSYPILKDTKLYYIENYEIKSRNILNDVSETIYKSRKKISQLKYINDEFYFVRSDSVFKVITNNEGFIFCSTLPILDYAVGEKNYILTGNVDSRTFYSIKDNGLEKITDVKTNKINTFKVNESGHVLFLYNKKLFYISSLNNILELDKENLLHHFLVVKNKIIKSFVEGDETLIKEDGKVLFFTDKLKNTYQFFGVSDSIKYVGFIDNSSVRIIKIPRVVVLK